MAICVTFNSKGEALFPGTAPTACPGYVLIDSTEYQAQSLIDAVLGIPDSSYLAAAWSAGFLLPMTVALAAYCVRAVVSPFRS